MTQTTPIQSILRDFTPDMVRAFGKILVLLADEPKEEWNSLLREACEKANQS